MAGRMSAKGGSSPSFFYGTAMIVNCKLPGIHNLLAKQGVHGV